MNAIIMTSLNSAYRQGTCVNGQLSSGKSTNSLCFKPHPGDQEAYVCKVGQAPGTSIKVCEKYPEGHTLSYLSLTPKNIYIF
jgi:hypothetical protein